MFWERNEGKRAEKDNVDKKTVSEVREEKHPPGIKVNPLPLISIKIIKTKGITKNKQFCDCF